MAEIKNGKSDVWLKILLTALVAIFMAGLASLESRKLNKDVYETTKTFRDEQIKEIKESLLRIEVAVGARKK